MSFVNLQAYVWAVSRAHEDSKLWLRQNTDASLVEDLRNSGQPARVYTRSGPVWTPQAASWSVPAALDPPDEATPSRCPPTAPPQSLVALTTTHKLVGAGAVGGAMHGFSVALSADGNTGIAGAPPDNRVTGAAWVHNRSGGLELDRAFLHSLWLDFDLARPPSLSEPRLQRPAESQHDIPTLSRDGLDPVALFAGWSLRAKVDIHRFVSVHQKPFGLAAYTGELLISLQHRTCLVTVNDQGPELLHGNTCWQMQHVHPAAIERRAFRILDRPRVLRSSPTVFVCIAGLMLFDAK